MSRSLQVVQPRVQQGKEWLILGDVYPDSVPRTIPIAIVTTDPATDTATDAGTATIEDPIHFSSCPRVEGKYTHSILAAHDGSTLVSVEATSSPAVIEIDGTSTSTVIQFQVHRYDISTRKILSPPVLVSEQVTSIYIRHTAVYLGFQTSVGWIDFASAAASPVYEQIYVNNLLGVDVDSSNKAYDMFICHDDTLVAIDDCCFPFYADTFVLDPDNGRPIHVRHWELPWLVNGRYTMAAASPNNQELQLFLASEFHCRGGLGRELWRLEFEECISLSSTTSRPIHTFASRPKGTRLTEVRRMDGTCDSLTPNMPETNGDWFGVQWNAMAVTKDLLLLAAGRRGILSLPLNFGPETKACAFPNLGGWVWDVTVLDNNVIWVLVAPPPPVESLVADFTCVEDTNSRLADVSWQIIKLDRNHQVQLRIPIQGSRNLHFVGANGRERSSYHSTEGAERAGQDAKDDL